MLSLMAIEAVLLMISGACGSAPLGPYQHPSLMTDVIVGPDAGKRTTPSTDLATLFGGKVKC